MPTILARNPTQPADEKALQSRETLAKEILHIDDGEVNWQWVLC
jgi:hypothetical protein